MSAGAELGVRDPSCLSRGVVVGLWADDSPAPRPRRRRAHRAHPQRPELRGRRGCRRARGAKAGPVGRAVHAAAVHCEELSKAAAGCDAGFADEILLPAARAGLGSPSARCTRAAENRRRSVTARHAGPAGARRSGAADGALRGAEGAARLPRGAMAMVLRCGGERRRGRRLRSHHGCEPRLRSLARPAARKHVLYADALVEAADRLFDAKLKKQSVAAPAGGRRAARVINTAEHVGGTAPCSVEVRVRGHHRVEHRSASLRPRRPVIFSATASAARVTGFISQPIGVISNIFFSCRGRRHRPSPPRVGALRR